MDKIVLIVILSIMLLSCNDSGTTPGDFQPGRRDYSWTEDTLKLNDNILNLYSIWGKTPDDIWAGGICSSGKYTLWHWNGESWKSDSTIRYWDITSIHGLASDRIWCAYESGYITYFDGENWNYQEKITVDGYDLAWFQDICGERYDEVYGVGSTIKTGSDVYRAILFKFENDTWKQVNIPELSILFVQAEIDNLTKDLFISSIEFTDTGIIDRIYLFRNNELELLMESDNAISVNKIGDHVYILDDEFMYNSETYDIIKSKQQNILASNYSCVGRSKNDIIQMSDNGYYHYNGFEKKLIYPHDRYNQGMMLFENDFFAITVNKNTGTNIVVHGILTDLEE